MSVSLVKHTFLPLCVYSDDMPVYDILWINYTHTMKKHGLLLILLITTLAYASFPLNSQQLKIIRVRKIYIFSRTGITHVVQILILRIKPLHDLSFSMITYHALT
jgi:hypothetical protein